MKHEADFEYDLKRNRLDEVNRHGLSKESLEDLEQWCLNFVLLLKTALLDSYSKGIMMPRQIKINGKIEVSDE